MGLDLLTLILLHLGDSCRQWSLVTLHSVDRSHNGIALRCSMAGTLTALSIFQFKSAGLLVQRFPTAKRVFMDLHVDTLASKLDALHGEAKALFCCGFTPQLDFASSTHDALPR
jgi:hypothetical protein